ncbi:MAG: ATP12 family protein [Pacificimonas sp.]
MKRFYRAAKRVETNEGWRIELDGRGLNTPKRRSLVLPTETMADAIREEWEAQGDIIDPVSMPVTGLANAAIDHVAPDRAAFQKRIAAYGESDLLCYRADAPAPLVERQCAAWDPLLSWAAKRYDIGFTLAEGITHRPQAEMTLQRLSAALDAYDDFALAAAQPLTTISGSLVITLALIEGEIDADTAWISGELDELYQAETWGEDAEATAIREHRRAAFDAAARFLTLR